ncbi:PQQ-dependent sugar dehydrogenase [Albidovulum sp.]|jgi:glucose/arabinose dehydrogenase|uniref:PQQ-dependent sugar dehydrogenase n=1 Tax=Albidovulum sp. TaxID=1872424 RepID=UPI0039B983DC
MRPTLLPAAIALVAAPAFAGTWDEGERNAPGLAPAFEGQTRAPQVQTGMDLAVETLAGGLDHPWGIAVLPEGGYLVTERSGRLNHVGETGEVREIAGVPEVHAEKQGGLLDVALAEDFATSRTIYLTYAKPMGEGLSATAAARATLAEDMTTLTDLTEIFVQNPSSPSPMHYGSRIVPDGDQLWITTGEHSAAPARENAQDVTKTWGKVVRLMADGSVPADNPFAGQGGAADQVWTLGHRNIQGAALAPDGALWTLEHGPMGGDELNRIERGANYGWPEVSYGLNYDGTPVGTGEAHGEGFAEPVYFWDPVIAPGGFLFYEGAMFPDWQGDILAASLTPGGLVRLELEGGRVAGEERFLYGERRIRDVAVDREGAVLLLVDDAEGAILRLTPAAE